MTLRLTTRPDGIYALVNIVRCRVLDNIATFQLQNNRDVQLLGLYCIGFSIPFTTDGRVITLYEPFNIKKTSDDNLELIPINPDISLRAFKNAIYQKETTDLDAKFVQSYAKHVQSIESDSVKKQFVYLTRHILNDTVTPMIQLKQTFCKSDFNSCMSVMKKINEDKNIQERFRKSKRKSEREIKIVEDNLMSFESNEVSGAGTRTSSSTDTSTVTNTNKKQKSLTLNPLIIFVISILILLTLILSLL